MDQSLFQKAFETVRTLGLEIKNLFDSGDGVVRENPLTASAALLMLGLILYSLYRLNRSRARERRRQYGEALKETENIEPFDEIAKPLVISPTRKFIEPAAPSPQEPADEPDEDEAPKPLFAPEPPSEPLAGEGGSYPPAPEAAPPEESPALDDGEWVISEADEESPASEPTSTQEKEYGDILLKNIEKEFKSLENDLQEIDARSLQDFPPPRGIETGESPANPSTPAESETVPSLKEEEPQRETETSSPEATETPTIPPATGKEASDTLPEASFTHLEKDMEAAISELSEKIKSGAGEAAPLPQPLPKDTLDLQTYTHDSDKIDSENIIRRLETFQDNMNKRFGYTGGEDDINRFLTRELGSGGKDDPVPVSREDFPPSPGRDKYSVDLLESFLFTEKQKKKHDSA